MQAVALEGGFENAPVTSAQAFRGIMTAMACPGTIQTVLGATPPAPLSPAAGAVVLTLCDSETCVFLAGAFDCPEVRDWITFHTGAPIGAAEGATFAIGPWADLPTDQFAIGTAEYPDRSATLIVECSALTTEGATLRGPGIKETAALSLPEKSAFQANATLFPLGLDFIFTCQNRLAALPRTTKVS